MITQIKFHNFRVLQDAALPLQQVTLLIGPNGSGKSTALQALRMIARRATGPANDWLSLGVKEPGEELSLDLISDAQAEVATFKLFDLPHHPSYAAMVRQPTIANMASARVFALDPREIAKPSQLQKTLEIGETGGNMPSVLTTLQDQFPERFEALNRELHHCLPEFDRILLDTIGSNQRAFALRTKVGRYPLQAGQLSDGTLIAVALLTLSHLPNPPVIVGLEEIDRAIHPRLLRDVQDAVMHLAFPRNFGDDRKPVQVIMTTHSPYFVDLFRDQLENIVIAEKDGLCAFFHRLADMPNHEEILRGISLGDAWYSGIVGGVPTGTSG